MQFVAHACNLAALDLTSCSLHNANGVFDSVQLCGMNQHFAVASAAQCSPILQTSSTCSPAVPPGGGACGVDGGSSSSPVVGSAKAFHGGSNFYLFTK
eukprot:scaffold245561_cov17-Tisochrysis_lutea.AAC.2